MSFILNCLAFFLCWLGSASVYMSSNQQLILPKSLSKIPAWTSFALCVCSALAIMTSIHHWLAALLTLLVFIMTAWILLVLTVPYFPNQLKVLVIGTLFTITTAIIGGFYVV